MKRDKDLKSLIKLIPQDLINLYQVPQVRVIAIVKVTEGEAVVVVAAEEEEVVAVEEADLEEERDREETENKTYCQLMIGWLDG